MKRYLIPLGIFLVLAVFLGVGLKLNPREVPSPLVGKAGARLQPAHAGRPGRAGGGRRR